jgi:putative sterol carrier protein
MGLATVIMSYDGQITMNLVADKGIVKDVRMIREYLRETFRELRDAVGVRPVEVVIVQETRVVIEELKPEPAETTIAEVPPPAPVATSNGNYSEEETAFAAQPEVVVETVAQAIIEDARPAEPHGFPLFSQAWADNFRDAINKNPDYKRTSTHWRAGALAFLLRASAGKPSAAVLLDLHQGDCRDARSLPVYEATQRAAFAIEGDHHAWMRVLHGEVAPLAALMRGDLRLAKGSLLKLLPFTQSAEQLVMSAQRVPLET